MTNPISIINETTELSALGVYLACGSALTHAALALILRRIGKTEHPATTALIHNLLTSLIITFSIIFFGTKFYGKTGNYGIEIFTMSNNILYTLITLGIIGSFVQYLMAQSYKYAEATILVTLRYLAIPLATLFGVLIWDEIPTYNQIIGGLIVIGSCLLITYREIKTK